MDCKLIAAAALALTVALRADTAHAQSATIGHPPASDALKAIDIDVLPDGRGLPPGSGTAERGRSVYAARCASCHGATGTEGAADILAGGRGTLQSPGPLKTVGSYWPYATTLWDYIHRAMPFEHPRSMSTDDTYAVTAFVLFLNGIVGERDALSDATLAQVKMPNRDGFVRDPRPDVPRPTAGGSASPRR